MNRTGATPEDAVLAAQPALQRRSDVVWTAEDQEWAVVILRDFGAGRAEHLYFCQREPNGWVVRATDADQSFYAYDGSSPPWIKHVNNPLGVGVRRHRAGDDVIAVRLGPGDTAVEQTVVDGHWYQANFHVRQWGPSRPWATLSAIRLADLSW